MSLRSERTKWVMFLPCSGIEADFRHVADLVFGVMCLEKAGVNPQDIFIYIDSPGRNFDGAFMSASTHGFVSKPTPEFFNDLLANDYDNLVMFVTGHGGPDGIDAAQPITPNQLLKALKSTPNLKNAIIYLGQCFAGTFNFVSAGRVNKDDASPDVILVGATNLQESLSHGTTETFITGEQFPWSANVFLLHVFKWMSSPTDVDGDGVYTVMDSYKHAGIFTNMINKKIKNDGFSDILDMHAECGRLKKLAAVITGVAQVDFQNQLDYNASQVKYDNLLAIHHVNQECWILNSRPAQLIEF
ncbi:caspase family protein [Enterobacter bugandensis]|uniref:hypothetical protein n=1 Tax=Enterobacter bugandensis TaxID=881260 RepID=UPI0007A45F32|nr:hypothetical protein [Enterobacter bugandensis]EMC1013077.1 hypothetical protein [Enterobacter bugandensis]